MYEGELITFRFKDKESLAALSLFEIELESNEESIIVKKKENGEVLGELDNVIGIDFEQMLRILGYENQE